MRITSFHRVTLACAAIAMACDLVGSAALSPLLPSLKSELDVSHGMIGLFVGLSGIGYAIGTYPALRLSVRVGLIPTTMIGAFVVAIGTLTLAFSANFEVLCAGRLCMGIGSVAIYTAILAIAEASAGTERRGMAIGMVYSGMYAGSTLGPLISTAAVGFGRALVFGLLALVQVVIGGLAPLLPTFSPGSGTSLRETFGCLRARPALVALWITGIPPFGLGILIVSGSFRISEIGGSSLVIALAFSAMAVLYVVSSPPLGHLSDTYGRARPLIVLLLLATVALLVLMMVTMPLPAAALIAVGGTLLTLVGGPSFALLTDAVQAQGKSTVEATFLMNLYWGPSAALGAILGGIFHGAVGAELSFAFLAVVLVASAGLVARYARSAT